MTLNANSTDALYVGLRRYDNQSLVLNSPAYNAFLGSSQAGLVHLNPATQPIATGSNHRAPQLVQPLPGGSITARPEDPLQAQGAGAVRLAGHKPHRPKPDGEGRPHILKHGARRHRRLTVAPRTLEQGGTHRPRLATSATWTPKPLGPPQPKEVIATTFFGREPGLKFLKSPRVIFHPATILPVGAT